MSMDPIPSTTTQIMLSALYETATDQYDHYSNHADTDPLARVAMHSTEVYKKSSGLYRAIRRYEHQRINSRYNLSLTEYLDLPREMISMMTTAADDAIRELEEAKAEAKEAAGADSRDTQATASRLGPIVGGG